MKGKFIKAVNTGLITKIIAIVATCALIASAGLIGATLAVDRQAEQTATVQDEETAVAVITPDWVEPNDKQLF